MNILRPLTAASCLIVACCVPAPKPAPEPSPIVVAPAPAPPLITAPAFENWMDAPATPGNWSYHADSSGTIAMFGQANSEPRFALRCNPARGVISLLRAGTGTGNIPLRIRTESAERMVTATQQGDQLPTLRADITARDPLLEAMAFSKGRFAVKTAGLPTLYIPAWPEVTRVIEDCR